MEDGRYLTPDSLALIPENHYRMSAQHYLIGDKPSLMFFYNYLLSANGKLKEDGVYLMEDGRYLTPDSLALIPENHYRMSAQHYLIGDKPSLMVFYNYLFSANGKLMEDGVYLMEDGRYLTPDSLALTPENDYRMSAHHYLIVDNPSLMVFYDYLFSANGKLMEEGRYLTPDSLVLMPENYRMSIFILPLQTSPKEGGFKPPFGDLGVKNQVLTYRL